jgi:hypothetical protein
VSKYHYDKNYLTLYFTLLYIIYSYFHFWRYTTYLTLDKREGVARIKANFFKTKQLLRKVEVINLDTKGNG